MLLELKVQNFAIIENITLQFTKGLNILSGETGAGKSILLKSLTLLMGEKADSETVRSGCETATVEGSFDIANRYDIQEHLSGIGIDSQEETLVVRRIISSQGKSRVYINGCLSTLNTLQSLVAPLIELTGHKTPLIELTSQHENKNLMSKPYHLEILDHYIGAIEIRTNYRKKFERYCQIQEEILALEEKNRTQAQKIDFLKYQKEEIEALKLRPGEEQLLEAEYSRIKNSTKIANFVDEVETALFGDDDSALVRIHRVFQKSHEFGSLDPELKKIFEPLAQSKTLLEELIYDLRSYSKNLSVEPDALNELEERITQLRHLQKKYGKTVDDILKSYSEICTELSTLENSDVILDNLKKEESLLQKELQALAKELHKRRSSGADLLAKSVNDELKDLNMKGVQLVVEVAELKELNQSGLSDIEFKIQASPKEPARTITKFASGGELSRILLSLKKVIGFNELPRTYLFDEVDTGVSGQTAEKVGKKLKSISKGQQVICVTHLAQVAAFADSHFLIEKKIAKNSTQMTVIELSSKDREHEIARLISGEKITKTSLDHAKELLKAHS